MRLISRITGVLAAPFKTSGLGTAGELGYDNTTGKMSYRDGVAGVDRVWPTTMLGTRSVQGIVNTAGSGTIVKGSGFTISRAGTGDLTVTFTPAFADVPAVTLSVRTAAAVFASLTSTPVTASAFRCGIFNMDTPFANVDAEFHFHALSTSGELGPNPMKSAAVAFTDGDTLRRVSVVDANVSATSNISGSVRRPDILDSADRGYIYNANIVRVYSGGFDLLIAATGWGFDDPTKLPPNETVQFVYVIG